MLRSEPRMLVTSCDVLAEFASQSQGGVEQVPYCHYRQTRFVSSIESRVLKKTGGEVLFPPVPWSFCGSGVPHNANLRTLGSHGDSWLEAGNPNRNC